MKKIIKISIVLFILVIIVKTNNCLVYGGEYEKNGLIYHGTPCKKITSEEYNRLYLNGTCIKISSNEYWYLNTGLGSAADYYILTESNLFQCDSHVYIGEKQWYKDGKVTRTTKIYRCAGHVKTGADTNGGTTESSNSTNTNTNNLVTAILPNGYDENLIPNGNGYNYDNHLRGTVTNAASIVILVMQILVVSGIIITGIRYMYAGADSKNKIKQTIPFLLIGIIIVFAGPAVIQFIVDVFEQITAK